MMKKKKKNNSPKLNLSNSLMTILLGILLSLSIVYIYKTLNPVEPRNTTNISNNNQNTTTKEDEPKVTKASLIMLGDNLIHGTVYKDANEIANGGKRDLSTKAFDFTGMYSLLKPIVSTYDIAYYNQETILGGSDLGVSDYPTFNSPYEVGDTMIDAGFNLVSLATNHTMDSGEKAVLNSREYWNSHPEVLAVGSYSSTEERNKVDIRETNGITYTMLNYTYGTNGMPVPKGKDYLVNVWPTDFDNINNPDKDTKYQAYKEQVKEDIDKVRDKVDVLIVAMHWGVEYTHEPTVYEKDMANYLASLNVDIVIGTHPHVVQPITKIGNTIVYYSLGNLISAQYQNQDTCTNYKCMVGLMSSLDITKTTKDGKTTIELGNFNNELIYNYYNQATWRGYKVIPFSNPEIATHLKNYQTIYNTYKEVVQKYDSSIKVATAYEG